VVKGNFKIDSALQIMAKPSMMTPEGGGGGGGHDHGSPKSSPGESGPAAGDLTPLSRHQIHAVIMAADNVNKAITERNLSKIHSAFADLGKTIKEVNMELLTGHMHMLWMDLSMRLTNDAVEGSQVKNLEAAARIAGIMADNIKSLKSKLGITPDNKQASRPTVSEAFVEQLAKIFEGYFAIQQTLADDKPETVSAASGQLLTTLKAIDMKLVTGKDHDLWMKHSTDIRAILQNIAKTSDIKSQREYFYQLSQHIIKLAKHFGAPVSKPFYVLHCPMAFDNRGAEWLQSNDQTRNPYFGQMMLQCGGVTEVVPVTIIKNKKDN
jgi:Cu(I)/Ag(I) efflux system membrane fusion protein